VGLPLGSTSCEPLGDGLRGPASPSSGRGRARPNELTDQEFRALKQIGDARPISKIALPIKERLASTGYAREDHAHGLVITDAGMLRIMSGK
jgi:hypothetical protein